MSSLLERALTRPLADIARESKQGQFDCVVVGGGTAGITAALTLVESGKRVALLEAGPLALLTHSTTTDLRFDRPTMRKLRAEIDYRPKLAGGGEFGTLIGCLGGRGLFWNGAAPRFSHQDFATWPYNAADLASEYQWAEHEFRVSRDYGGPALTQTICRLLRMAGMPAEPGPFAIDTRPTTDGWIGGTVANAVAILVRSAAIGLQTEHLKIAVGSIATEILFGASKSEARGVTAIDRASGVAHEILAASVVLAAGAFESVQLAMSSKLPDRGGRMGKRILEHLFSRVYFNVPPEIYDAAKPEAAIVYVPAANDRKYQIELHLPGNNLFLLRGSANWKPARNADYAAMVRAFAAVGGRPDNFIEPGPPGTPGSYTVHFPYSPEELTLRDTMVAALERVGKALNADVAEVTVLPPGASFHEAGGLPMGTDSTSSVTDPFGRVHGSPRVVVVDASCWPGIGAANPHLTIAATSRRHARQLANDLTQ
jgi:choline dehydrogenase-like flavoprotein